MGRAPSVLSMVSVTSARPSGGREVVPAKTTSSILPPRSDLAPCSPMTQDRASTMLDLPEPFGPTTQVMPGSRRSVVAEAKDLKPRRVRLFRYKLPPSLRFPAPYRPEALKSANCRMTRVACARDREADRAAKLAGCSRRRCRANAAVTLIPVCLLAYNGQIYNEEGRRQRRP